MSLLYQISSSWSSWKSTSTLSYSSMNEDLVSSSKRLVQTSSVFSYRAKIEAGSNHMDQTTGRDNLFDTTIIEGLTDNVAPQSSQDATEVRSNHIKVTSNTLKNLQFSCRSRILLFKGDGESFKNAFSLRTLVPINRPSSEPLPLVLPKANNVESFLRLDELTNLLQEDTLTF